MKIDIKELNKLLENKINDIIFDSQEQNRIIEELFQKYNFPKLLTSQIINGQISMYELEDCEVFWLLDVICPDKINKFFTSAECEEYALNTYIEKSKITFPYKIPCFKVSETQYVTVCDSKTLLELNSSRKLNYNKDTQRVMRKIRRKTYLTDIAYRIYLNAKAVKKIFDLFMSDKFIPNTITLNMCENADFYFDEDKNMLVINELDHFDILDGFHRLTALYRCHYYDSNFNYKMILQITHFDTTKAKMFIYQEDQKTKMSTRNSNSFDMSKDSVLICEKLNNDSMFNLYGKIGRNEAQINLQDMETIINYFCKNKESNSRFILSTKNMIRDKWNLLTEFDENLLDIQYEFNELSILIYSFFSFDDFNNDVILKVCEILSNKNQLISDNVKFKRKDVKKTLFNDIQKFFE